MIRNSKGQFITENKFNKDIFEYLYWGKGLSLSEIGKELNIAPETVRYYMNKYKVPRRNVCEATIIANKKRWENEENRKKMSLISKMIWQNPRFREKITKNMKENNPMKCPEIAKKVAEWRRNNMCGKKKSNVWKEKDRFF